MEEIFNQSWPYIYAMGLVTVRSPIDRYIILCQTKSLAKTPSPYTSIWKYLTIVHKIEGFKGYWRGNFSHILQVASGITAAHFSKAYIYFFTFSYLSHSNKKSTALSAEVLSSGFTKLLAFPFDKVRTLLSCDFSSENNKQYKGIYHCMTDTVKNKRFYSLFEGYSINLSSFVIYLGVTNYLGDALRRRTDSINHIILSMPVIYFAHFITYPLDLIKSRKQVIGEHLYESESKSFLKISSKIFNTEGLRGFYRGFLVWNVQIFILLVVAQMMGR